MFSSVNFENIMTIRNHMLHPALAHFAISLPIISLILGLLYLYKPSETMSKISSRFLVFAALFMIAAFFSGKNDAPEVFDFLSADGKGLLVQHAELGLYLAIGMGLVAVIKLIGCMKSIFKVELLAIALLLILSGATLFQGKLGGALTYEYGAHVKEAQELSKQVKVMKAELSMCEDDEDEDEEDED